MAALKAATKVQRAKAIGEAAAKVQLPADMVAAMAAGELVIVSGMSAGVAMTVQRCEQRAAKALASEGRAMATPNVEAFGAKVHEVKVKGTAGIGGRADHSAMAEHVTSWLADPTNRGTRGWSACAASRDCQRANPGRSSWPHYRVLFADAVTALEGGSVTATIEAAKGRAMLAGVSYGQGDEGTFDERFATWCADHDQAGAKALGQLASERAAAKVASDAKAAERAAAKVAAKANEGAKVATSAKASEGQGIDQAKADQLTSKASTSADRADQAKAERAAKRAATRAAKAKADQVASD